MIEGILKGIQSVTGDRVVSFMNHMVWREFVKILRFPYLRSERLPMKIVSESDTFSLSVLVFRSIVKVKSFSDILSL